MVDEKDDKPTAKTDWSLWDDVDEQRWQDARNRQDDHKPHDFIVGRYVVPRGSKITEADIEAEVARMKADPAYRFRYELALQRYQQWCAEQDDNGDE